MKVNIGCQNLKTVRRIPLAYRTNRCNVDNTAKIGLKYNRSGKNCK